jgi:putative methionine-R-sulfoxide reductase with GAF domain
VTGTLEAVRSIVEQGVEADDVLRAVVESMVSTDGVQWAGVAFIEDDELLLGPSGGAPDESRRERVPVAYDGAAVGELWADGEIRRNELEQIAALIAPYVLIGWDTGGEAWEP